jgi:uncharacterized membrane protein
MNGLGAIVVILFIFSTMLPAAVKADTEPNDTTGTADPISSGDTVTGYVSAYSDPDDYYSIYLSSGQRISATLSGTGSDFDLYLYDRWDDIIASSEGAYSTESISYTVSSSGTYYLDVYAYSGSGSYTLSVSVSGSVLQDITSPSISMTSIIPPPVEMAVRR